MSIDERLRALETAIRASEPTFEKSCSAAWSLDEWFIRLADWPDIDFVRRELAALFQMEPESDEELRAWLRSPDAVESIRVPLGMEPSNALDCPPDQNEGTVLT